MSLGWNKDLNGKKGEFKEKEKENEEKEEDENEERVLRCAGKKVEGLKGLW